WADAGRHLEQFDEVLRAEAAGERLAGRRQNGEAQWGALGREPDGRCDGGRLPLDLGEWAVGEEAFQRFWVEGKGHNFPSEGNNARGWVSQVQVRNDSPSKRPRGLRGSLIIQGLHER